MYVRVMTFLIASKSKSFFIPYGPIPMPHEALDGSKGQNKEKSLKHLNDGQLDTRA